MFRIEADQLPLKMVSLRSSSSLSEAVWFLRAKDSINTRLI